MKTYRIEVSRCVEQTAYVDVDAEDRDSAIEEAEMMAQDLGNDEWDLDDPLSWSDIETGSVEVLTMEDGDVDDGDPKPKKKDRSEKESEEEEDEDEDEEDEEEENEEKEAV